MAEKTKKSSEGSRRSPERKPAAKKSAAKSKKPKTARKSQNKKTTAKKTAAKSARQSTTKAEKSAPKTPKTPKTGEELTAVADSKETLAERRIAGGQNAKTSVQSANENQLSVETLSGPPQAKSRTKPESRVRSGETAESGPRPNTLVPTNGIHTTQRRMKRGLHQNRGVMALIAATLLGIFILGEQTTPPDMSDFEQQVAASQATDSYAETTPAETTPADPSAGAPAHDSGDERFPSERAPELDDSELVEMERLLARLDLGPSAADGIVDQQTETAIRLYQEFAGLPINGAPSRALLADMREVAGILDNGS